MVIRASGFTVMSEFSLFFNEGCVFFDNIWVSSISRRLAYAD